MKAFKKAVALVLCLVMTVGVFAVAGITVDDLAGLFKAEAAITLSDGSFSITQQPVTIENRESKYREYQKRFFTGEETNWPTNFVIPGLGAADNYTPQGMTYWKAKEWILISAYDAGGSDPSVIYALDVVSTELVAVFKIQNADGSTNTSHGGGIAASEYNFYYADADSKISYIPLSEMDVAKGTVKTIKLKGSINLASEMNGGSGTSVKTSYCCYDEGVLWTGNFYISSDNRYNTPFLSEDFFPSVLLGYKLAGNNSAEEWKNLQDGSYAKATDRFKGCVGDPTYVVGLNFDRVQYAMVDKGKLYISRSWSRYESENHIRQLAIADIDLSISGHSNVPIAGTDRPVHTIYETDLTTFSGNNMLYMGEALCVINDYLYMFTEGAAYAYWGGDGKTPGDGSKNGVCREPIDVIWKIDQYAVQGLTRPHEDVTAVEYEKVNSLSEINNVDEYIIAYESPVKDPVTQDNILYLFDAFGGYGEHKLAKNTSSSGIDCRTAGYQFGMVGYELRDYSLKNENGKESIILNAEDDANKSLHWQFESGSSTSLKLRSRELYYAKHPYLRSGAADLLFSMTSTPDAGMKISGDNKGNFKIGNGDYTLWCNDGTIQEQMTFFDNYYANYDWGTLFHPNFYGYQEVPGTFYPLSTAFVGSDQQQVLHIYKRVSDPYTSSYETQVYTDLKAELTSDGTYNITLETYATNNLQYQRVNERPTDFIFVLDSTGSMLDDKDCSGYIRYGESNTLSAYSVANKSTSIGDTGAVTGATGNIYYMADDGIYYQLYVDASSRGDDGSWISHKYYKYYWLYYKKNGVNVYYNPSTKGWQTTKPSESEVGKSFGNSDSARADCIIYTGVHYEKSNSLNRLQAVQNTVESLTYKIAAEANSSGLDHRIAVCSFGTDGSTTYGYQWTGTNMYINDGTEISYPNITTDNYKNAFFSVSQFGTLRNTIYDKMEPLGHSYPSYGLDMASKIIDNSDYEYDVNGTRSAVVIVISDGVPGWEEDDNRNLTVTKNTANDTLANGAYNLKRNGAYVYSVLLGNDSHFSESDFSTTDFMKYLSSEYTGSVSMTNPGPHNTKENVNYYLQVPRGSAFNLDNTINQIFSDVVANSNNAIASLTTEAILREHLTDAFDLTNATITYQTAKSKYDGIGRLYFEAPKTASGFTTTFDKANNNIEVKGFDYSAKNVSEYNSNLGNGEKLIITISGVIAKHDKELLNTSINDTSKTALYQNRSYMSDTLANDKPVKRFPTYHFTIPEYTYYMDYDIPMYDSDINGTLCSVDSTLQKQSTYKTSLSTGNMGIQFVNENLDMVYTLNSQAGLTENLSKGYVLIQRDDGTYDWFRLNIVPASTVYYEENKMETLDGTQSFTEWTESGSFDGKYQSLSTENDVFGNDETYYNSKDQFSLGTNKSVTVTASDNRSDTQSFTFTGTGFDLISACGSNTGIQTVTVKQHQTDGSMKIVKVFMVDTFYNDRTYGTIYQVPVVQFKGDYATYTVETTAAYYSFAGGLVKTQSVDTYAVEGTELEATSAVADTFSTDELFAQVGMDELIGQEVELVWMDDDSVLNGGLGVQGVTLYTQTEGSTATPSLVNYFDGFRIYNPIAYNNEYIVSEQNATFYSVIDAISAGGMGGDSFAGYLEGGTEGTVFGDYLTSGGPKYEVYLKPGNSIAFRFKAKFAEGSSPQAMVSVRAAAGSPKAKFSNSNPEDTRSYETGVLSGSETYYNITNNTLGVGSDGSFILTVTNTGDGLLAVDNIKITNAELVPFSGISLAELNQILSTQAVEIAPHAVKSATYTYSQAPEADPSDTPVVNPPSLEELIALNSGSNNAGDKFTAIIEMIKSFLERIIAFLKNAIKSLPLDWLFNI